MAFLTIVELSTHMREEIMDTISNNDDSLVQFAIDAAMEEASGYLSNYDYITAFDAAGTARNPVLLMYIKDIAVWHYIQLANPNIDMTLREKRYEFAVKWLEKVQAGKVTPFLPALIQDVDAPVIGKLRYGSNIKRNTRY